MHDNNQHFSPNENSEIIISKTIMENKRRRKKMSAYYSFLTVVLLFCLLQITCSAVLNISKVISYQQKIQVMKNSKNQVLKKNAQLKSEISNFSSSSWESIARNNLKMSGDNEILILIDDKIVETEN